MDIWHCLACDYVYDLKLGDPEDGIPPGRRFEDLPSDWTCPVCGVAKGQFVKHTLSDDREMT